MMKKKIKKFVKKALKKSTFTISLIPPPKFKVGDIVGIDDFIGRPLMVNNVIHYPNQDVDYWFYGLLNNDGVRFWEREGRIHRLSDTKAI